MTEADVQSLIAAREANVAAGISPPSILGSGGIGTPAPTTVSTSSDLRTSTSYGTRTAPTIQDVPYQYQTTPIEAPFYRTLREQQQLTPVDLLVGGFKAGVYYPSMLGSAAAVQPVQPVDTTHWLRRDLSTNIGYLSEWLRRDVDTGIQRFLTKDVTLRDISKSVLGEPEPKTFLEQLSGSAKWITFAVVAAIVLIFVVKK